MSPLKTFVNTELSLDYPLKICPDDIQDVIPFSVTIIFA